MYIVTQIFSKGPFLGAMYSKNTWEEAVNLAVEMVKEQCDAPEKEVRVELENDGDFRDPGGEWTIAIGTPEE